MGLSPKAESSRHDGRRVKRERSPKSVKRERSPTRKSTKQWSSRRRSPSSSSSSSGALEARLATERRRVKERRRGDKELMKARETAEQKRARRLAKKLRKEQKRKQAMGWSGESLGYSNVDNPFGDGRLTDTFVWQKKLDKDGLLNVSLAEVEQLNKQRVERNKDELEKVKRQREVREAQREEMEMMQRERESQQFVEWSKLEDQFHLQQARLRSKLRLKESRAKPIDLLARYIGVEEDDDDMEIEMQEPYHYLNGLDVRDLEDLVEDIKVYRKMESGKNDDYWKDCSVIAEEELQKVRRLDADAAAASFVSAGERREGMHGAVRKDVATLLKGKSHGELALLETQIMRKIKSHEEGVDVGYWETLLSMLKTHMARARLRERHRDTLRKKLARLKRQQGVDPSTGVKPEPAAAADEQEEEEAEGPSTSARTAAEDVERQATKAAIPWAELTEDEKDEQMMEAFEGGAYSPAYQTDDSVALGAEVVEPVVDQNRIDFARQQFSASGHSTAQQDALFEAEARKGMGGDEAVFAVEAPLEHKVYLWSDKYRPRKPRYFNRVHTGFEWNKYNQTHYDLDNPPPKIVQGYRFNIFYPDLLDPSQAPEFSVIPCKDDEDFAIVKFRAGPPYEDIAFKVVNREWEASHKRGYRCQFQNGVFQLWYHFKKYRYRR